MARQTAAQRLAEQSTTLDEDTTAPSTTAPGDGPADTTDPDERATSVTPQPGEDAIKAGTVNAVKPVPAVESDENAPADRFEEYTARRPDGSTVTVRRNITTGARELVDSE